ncbi:class I SAM-dependent methyltransferase [Aureispira anguillae]|uniref:Methyltransferase domain-containing protein n=1 Tax=Aureispira anguillae TaxID=2864201 RepID=A0A915YGF1_9BACT|nr:class I SAM-dependent methyltransferase [Aureispira anguillae]BDS12692.1 methyltransferase domain-containing protein [Aureispira anguillae]
MSTWFATWFDSSYYHLLYQHRDDTEAHFFMDNLVQHLQVPEQAKILDLACGKGRHSIYLADKNFDVVGVDLSPESIEYARQFEHKHLHFDTHDMRQPLSVGPFDYIFNLFTSFGYFPSEEEHLQTLQAMKNGLKSPNSTLVIDFFNAHKVIQNLVLSEEKTLSGISFKINRRVENGYILKDIRFEDQGNQFDFQERVRAFTLADFKRLFEQVGLKLVQTFGSFDLKPYDPIHSDRLILIAKPC